MTPLLRIAVVGHTNTGKTSLLRTLTRDATFGTVSDRPATTRRVEGASLMIEGERRVELFDTPGLEDSIGLLERLERMHDELGLDWLETIQKFLGSADAAGQYAQEAKALDQVLRSDVVLYVIDARDQVLGKYRDELEILGRCGVPVVPVLNFTASPEARRDLWREQLARANMHAVAEFDTVALDVEGERRLYETIKVLAGRFRATMEALVADIEARRRWLARASSELLADLLIDAAARVVLVRRSDPQRVAEAVERLKEGVRAREQRFVDRLLELHRFGPGDYAYAQLPVSDGVWGTDLFNPEALRQFGIRAASTAAAGAVAGLAIDVVLGGVTLGAAAATGAALGALFGIVRDKGGELMARLGGYSELRVDDATLRLLATRNAVLVDALFRRGHASQQPVRLDQKTAAGAAPFDMAPVMAALGTARARPEWSRIDTAAAVDSGADAARAAARDALAERIAAVLGPALKIEAAAPRHGAGGR
jgi:small GTP-binding protein